MMSISIVPGLERQLKAELSGDVLKSLEAGERATIEALGQFLVTVEEAVPQEVTSTTDVAKRITESGLETADRLVHTGHHFVRSLIDSIAKSLSTNGAHPTAAH